MDHISEELGLHACGSHPWQLAHSSSRTETSSRTVRVLSTAARTSCTLPDHSAAPASAATSERTTLASGPHHTPLSTGAMMHHTGGDIGGTGWRGEGNNNQLIIKRERFKDLNTKWHRLLLLIHSNRVELERIRQNTQVTLYI